MIENSQNEQLSCMLFRADGGIKSIENQLNQEIKPARLGALTLLKPITYKRERRRVDAEKGYKLPNDFGSLKEAQRVGRAEERTQRIATRTSTFAI